MNAAEPVDDYAGDVSELRPEHAGYGTLERDQRARWIADGSLVPLTPANGFALRESAWVRQQPFLALDDAGRIKAARRAIAGLDNDEEALRPAPRSRWA